MIDESSGIGETNFQLTRVFLHKVINALEIGLNKVRLGLVLYSDKPNLEFKLNTFKEKYEVLDYITKLPYRGGQAHTGAALNFVRKELFSQDNGGRAHHGVQQIAVVMTNGQSKDDPTKPAAKLRRSGVEVFAVGFKNANKTELKSIVSHPPRKHISKVKSFIQLPNINLRLKKLLCREIVVQSFALPALARSLKDGKKDQSIPLPKKRTVNNSKLVYVLDNTFISGLFFDLVILLPDIAKILVCICYRLQYKYTVYISREIE